MILFPNDWERLTQTDIDIQPTLGFSAKGVEMVSLGKAFARKDG